MLFIPKATAISRCITRSNDKTAPHQPFLNRCIVLTSVTLSLFFSANSHAKETNSTTKIEQIEVVGHDQDKAILSSGFNVDVLLTEEFKNGNYDLVDILQRSPGINVRRSGGLGSDFNLALNGLSGNQIRYFFDGIPMEDFGSALAFPANLVERIEVYKGVVPVSLGADALGGAVNVTTPDLDQSLIDLSYTYGSFNTHKGTLFAQSKFDNDWFVRLSVNTEHSDNDYWMSEVNDKDELGNFIGKIRVKRFHDQYTAGMFTLKTGVIDTRYADELSVAITYAENRNNEQHPDKTVNDVFGKKHANNETQLISSTYKKRFSDLSINAYFLIGKVDNLYTDEYSRDYDWKGGFVDKRDDTQGELSAKSLFSLTDDVVRSNIGGQYDIDEKNTVTLNYSYDYLKRKGHDSLNPNNRAFSIPNWVEKSITGLSYDSQSFFKNLDVSIFSKYYGYNGEINAQENINFNLVNTKTDVDINELGYGSALSLKVSNTFLVKASYEKAYRLPQAQEILGTGQYVLPNANLQPEQSDNINFGAKYEFDTQNTLQLIESNIFYRDSTNFIYYVADRVVYGQYKNLQDVETTGIEASYYLNMFDNYTLQLNATYQDLINKSRFDRDGNEDINYGNRMPNEPYFFANARFSTDIEINDDLITMMWTSSFVEEFFLHWEGSGNKADKLYIPSQLTHDIDIAYNFGDGDYNITFSARNIFDAQVYDNFNIEKPGRAFYLKFRYLY